MDCLVVRRSEQVDTAREEDQLKALATLGYTCRQLLTTTLSQEDRLQTYGFVREEHGYDATDPWLCDDLTEELRSLRPGSLVCVTGTELVCAYLGASTHSADFARLRDLRNLKVISLPISCLLPLPSRAPAPGEKAVFVGLGPDLDGWPCSCGPQGESWADGATDEYGCWYWAVYTEPGADNVLANKTMRLVHEANLIALPGLAAGAKGTPLEDAPSTALLQPLAATAQEEQALLFARGVVREMIASASEEPGIEAEALTDLLGSMRGAARERNSVQIQNAALHGERSNVVAMLSFGTAEELESELRLEKEQQRRDKAFLKRSRKFLVRRRAQMRRETQHPEEVPSTEAGGDVIAHETALTDGAQGLEEKPLEAPVPREALENALPSIEQLLQELNRVAAEGPLCGPCLGGTAEAAPAAPVTAADEAVPPAAADAGVAAPTPRAVAVAKEKVSRRTMDRGKHSKERPGRAIPGRRIQPKRPGVTGSMPERRIKRKTKHLAVRWRLALPQPSRREKVQTVAVEMVGPSEVKLTWTFPQQRFRRLRKHCQDEKQGLGVKSVGPGE
ncbi:URA2 [Symbiodinium natans]|uniref:URA2 protein n=1 Tax=Symbiodinium natans TaxID=878477 RepID=A0A812S9C8_9DINO|nr:URA2 [Symbiodinium natans]